MSDFWVRKDRKVYMIDKDLQELFYGDRAALPERKMAPIVSSEYVTVISIFVCKESEKRYGEN
jgi:hypothetical protein